MCLPLGLADRFSWQIAPPDICDSVFVNSKSRLLASVGTRLFPRIRFLWIELMLGFLGMQRGRGYVSRCCSINVLCCFVAEGVHNHLDRVGNVNGKCPCTYCTCVLLGLVLPFPLVSWCCYVVCSWIRWFETGFVLLFFGSSLCFQGIDHYDRLLSGSASLWFAVLEPVLFLYSCWRVHL